MAFDSLRGRVVLFGGTERSSGSATIFQDTWEWDGAAWAIVSNSGTIPRARYAHAMAYDSRRKRVVLFGGYDNNIEQDTWEYGP